MRSISPLARYTAILGAVSMAALTGCQSGAGRQAAALFRPTTANAATGRAPARNVKADELGRIPIIMYHSIGAPPIGHGARYDRRGLNISSDTFRKQLELMYAAGWYPMNMRDVLSARMNVPAGKTPVVLTFDDARGSQFRFRKDGSIDPACAVGVMEAFHTKHPDWPKRASFYVLPYSKWNPVPFWQRGQEKRKLQFLVDEGYEVANHSVSHRFMSHMDAKTLVFEMAGCVKAIRALAPKATMDTMALPYGAAPRNHALWADLLHGSMGGVTYTNRCILLAGGDPAYPPAHRKFDKTRIMRVSAEPGYVETWIRNLRTHRLCRPYVSDGDPNVVTVPKSEERYVNAKSLEGARLVVYNDLPAKKVVSRESRVERKDKTPTGKKK